MLHSRDKRIEEKLRQALSRIFQQEVKDPRVPPIFTVTQVRVAKDMRHANVYYSQLPDDEESLEKTAHMVRDCAGFIRTKLAREVNLKFTPELHFDYDPSEKDYQRINTKLNELKRSGQMGSDKPDEQA